MVHEASSAPRIGERLDGRFAAAICAAFGIWLALTVPASPAMGWDESMHVQLPAARFLVALRSGEFGLAIDALLGCAQYPPAWPAVLGFVQIPFGVGEALARALTSFAWAGALGFTFEIARRAAQSADARRLGGGVARLAGWTALVLGMLCPLADSFAGTLFLEVPSALATGFALWAWMRRADGPSARNELVAGVAITVALFTKWNYGLLLGAALALDWGFEFVGNLRGGTVRALLARTRTLAIVPFLACAWWFLLPLPGGLEVAAQHREAFAGFLAGNLGAAPASAAERVLYAATGIATTVWLAALVLVLALVALRCVRAPAVRVLAIASLFLLGAPLVHPFFLDRFLVPGLVPLFALAGVGLASIPRSGSLARTALILVFALITLLFPRGDGAWLADRLGRLPEAQPARGYAEGVLADRARLGPGRRLPSGGLERAEHDALLDLVAAEVRTGERVGWLGMSSEMSPAALHLGLLARGREQDWFLERDPPELDVAYFAVDPALDEAALRAFAARFDLILWTDPIDLRDRRERAFVNGYRDRLLALHPVDVRELGVVPISRPLRAPLAVRLFACRKVP